MAAGPGGGSRPRRGRRVGAGRPRAAPARAWRSLAACRDGLERRGPVPAVDRAGRAVGRHVAGAGALGPAPGRRPAGTGTRSAWPPPGRRAGTGPRAGASRPLAFLPRGGASVVFRAIGREPVPDLSTSHPAFEPVFGSLLTGRSARRGCSAAVAGSGRRSDVRWRLAPAGGLRRRAAGADAVRHGLPGLGGGGLGLGHRGRGRLAGARGGPPLLHRPVAGARRGPGAAGPGGGAALRVDPPRRSRLAPRRGRSRRVELRPQPAGVGDGVPLVVVVEVGVDVGALGQPRRAADRRRPPGQPAGSAPW